MELTGTKFWHFQCNSIKRFYLKFTSNINLDTIPKNSRVFLWANCSLTKWKIIRGSGIFAIGEGRRLGNSMLMLCKLWHTVRGMQLCRMLRMWRSSSKKGWGFWLWGRCRPNCSLKLWRNVCWKLKLGKRKLEVLSLNIEMDNLSLWMLHQLNTKAI